MIPMPSNTLTLEKLGESQTRRDLRLGNNVLAILWFADYEFANL
jgi:hypothetical protein